MKINMSHGSGGKATSELVEQVFKKNFSNSILDKMEDAAVLDVSKVARIAYTTDSFVVKPIFFKGGSIGSLAVCGTVNDLLMMGAKPKYLTVGFIIEEGLEINDLEKIAVDMKTAAEEAGVVIVAGDTKVVDGNGGIYINTSGIGIIETNRNINASTAKDGDVLIISGSLGNHHACILSHRMNLDNNIYSDCAPLSEIVTALLKADIDVKTMRDITRGGLATVLNEIAVCSQVAINIYEEKIPVDNEVKGFCSILGLDPLYMGNEGKMLCIVAPEDAERALELIRKSRYGTNASIIGNAAKGNNVVLTTRLGGKRIIDVLYGEGLPRIC